MDTQKVLCPFCHKEFDLSEGVTHQLKEAMRTEYEVENQKKVEELKKDLWRVAQEKAAEKYSNESEQKIKQIREERDKAVENERRLLKEKENFEDEKRKFEIEKDRQMAEVSDLARRKTENEYELKLKEREAKLESALRETNELRKKLEQGSQQSQGEIMELEIEEALRKEFPGDLISEVPKGVTGADSLQEVRDYQGRVAGVICWESKRTKVWSAGWITKLKLDQRATKAHEAVLVSQVLPDGVSNFDIREGIYVVNFESMLVVARILRQKLLAEASLKQSVTHDNEQLQLLHNYLMSPEFKGKIESLVEVGTKMQATLDKERKTFNSLWNMRQQEINQLINSTVGVHGSFRGILGESVLSLEGADLEDLVDD